jgi:hypothetical protein
MLIDDGGKSLPCHLHRYQVQSNKNVWREKEEEDLVELLILKRKPNTPPCQSASIGYNMLSVRDKLVKAERFTNLDFDQHICTRLYMYDRSDVD